MKWYQRLFWKTFGIIWLAGLLALMLTAWLVSEMSERQHFQQSMHQQAQIYARLMIEKYQRRGFRPFAVGRTKPPKGWLLEFKPEHQDPHARRIKQRIWHTMQRRVQIIDLTANRSIFTMPPKRSWQKQFTHQFKLYAHDRFYRIKLNVKPPFAPNQKVLGWFFSLQMLMLALLSAVAAFFVSLMITRPLQQLRLQVQSIYQQEAPPNNTKLKQRGDEIGELARDFMRMAEHIEQTTEAQQRLMQDVSHELRSPLARLQAAVGLLEQRIGLDNSALQRILHECDNLNALIGELLTLAHLQQHSNYQTQPIVPLLHTLVADVQLLHPKRKFNLQLEATELAVNPYLLERAVGNILNNACQYSPQEQPIDVRLLAQNGQVCLQVRDYGQGVSEAVVDALCEPFFRHQPSAQGFGLGLSIAKQAAEQMGAELEFQNFTQQGLQVSLRFTSSD